LRFARARGPSPASVSLPQAIGALRVQEVVAAGSKIAGEVVEVDPVVREWEAFLK